jgi:hypothetical protein
VGVEDGVNGPTYTRQLVHASVFSFVRSVFCHERGSPWFGSQGEQFPGHGEPRKRLSIAGPNGLLAPCTHALWCRCAASKEILQDGR